MAMQMQSLLLNIVVNSAYTSSSKLTRMTYPLGYNNPQMEKRVNIGVKYMANERPGSEPKLDSTSPRISTSFIDLFTFSGLAPERINGRLAMLGFVAAIAVELSSGTDLFSQISDGGAQWFVGTSILLSAASLVPFFKGSRAEAKTEGLMNANTELWNGRLAMLGLVALAVTELAKGGALV